LLRRVRVRSDERGRAPRGLRGVRRADEGSGRQRPYARRRRARAHLDGDHRAGPRRRADGRDRSLRRDEGTARWLLPDRRGRPRRGDRHRCADPERPLGLDRGSPDPRVMTTVAEVVDQAYRDDTGRAVATLIRVTRDFDLAEEAWQESCEQALRTWPQRGVPRDPTAWLFTAARNRAIDRLRRERVGREKTAAALQIAELEAMGDDMHEIPDDRLRLLFTCCHPS